MWTVSVYCRREEHLLACIGCIERAIAGRSAKVFLMVNGVPRTEAEGYLALRTPRPWLQVVHIPFACKSNAMNCFIHRLAPEAEVHFFIDGYALIDPAALSLLDTAIRARPGTNAAAAMVTAGRSAALLQDMTRQDHLLHGNFFALSAQFVQRLRDRRIFLPVGTYRGDAILGSLALFDLNTINNRWDRRLVAVCEEATWTFRTLSPLRSRDWKRYIIRRINQARGHLEISAVNEILFSRGPEALPFSCDEMLVDWVQRNGPSIPRDVFTKIVLARLRAPRLPGEAELRAEILGADARRSC